MFVTLSLLVTRVSIVSNGRTVTVNFSAFLGVVQCGALVETSFLNEVGVLITEALTTTSERNTS